MARAICAICLLLASGCTATNDPLDKPYTWRALGDNAANLRVMIADPQDLMRGREDATGLGAEAGPAVQRVLDGKRRPLPELSASGISTSAPGMAAPQAGPNGGANAGP